MGTIKQKITPNVPIFSKVNPLFIPLLRKARPSMGEDKARRKEEAEPSRETPPFHGRKGFIRKRFFILVLAGFAVFSILVISAFFKKTLPPPQSSPFLPDLATLTPQKNLSSIATESSFLNLEEDVKKLKLNLSEVDLSETKLSVPILELDINFKK